MLEEIFNKLKRIKTEMESAPNNRRMKLETEYYNLISVLKIMRLSFASNYILQKGDDGRDIPNV